MVEVIQDLQCASVLEVGPVLVALNVAVMLGAVAVGNWLGGRMGIPSVVSTGFERRLALLTALINGLVTLLGLTLWQKGHLRVDNDFSLFRGARDFALLLMSMDLAMYCLHRLAHWGPFYRWVHSLHHRFTEPRPVHLFALHPIETLAFGMLWLWVLWLVAPAWPGMMAYLTANLVLGVAGHLGGPGDPLVRPRIAGRAFHAGHHAEPTRHYGFYTTVWDWLSARGGGAEGR